MIKHLPMPENVITEIAKPQKVCFTIVCKCNDSLSKPVFFKFFSSRPILYSQIFSRPLKKGLHLKLISDSAIFPLTSRCSLKVFTLN